MLVRIQKNFDIPDVRQQTLGSSCMWGGVQFTFDPVKECDLFVALNPPNRDVRVRCPAGNKWLLTGESPIEQYRWHIDSFRYFDKVFTFWDDSVSSNIVHDQTALPWHVGRSYDDLIALTLEEGLRAKANRVSWVTSNATHKEGHKLRMGFKDYMLAQGFEFDLFGRGFSPIEHKFDGIFPYKYSIAVENYSCNDYWTEKIADCFLSWTIPIYWGAKNILSYFPARSMLLIDPNDKVQALKTIRAAIEEDYFGRNLEALAEARNLVLNKYQLFPHLCTLIDKYQVRPGVKRTSSFLPANAMHLGPKTPYSSMKRFIKRALLR